VLKICVYGVVFSLPDLQFVVLTLSHSPEDISSFTSKSASTITAKQCYTEVTVYTYRLLGCGLQPVNKAGWG